MKIWNTRLGLAMNSSSTHSLLLLGPDDELPTTDESHDFGWEYWTAASKEAKNNYFLITVMDNLKRLYPERVAFSVLKELFGDLPLADSEESQTKRKKYRSDFSLDGYIDHQSLLTLPRSWDGRELDYDFIEDLRKFLMNDRLVIGGGNDNDGHSHALEGKPGVKVLDLPDFGKEGDNEDIVARKDPVYDYWTVFNRQSGAKLRFSFDDLAKKPEKAFAPELVDLKITNLCPYACSFCYQDSTAAGKHASLKEINYVIDKLGEQRVMEVALGGGEPTLHPNFLEILQHCRYKNVTPNFTTKNLSWLRDPALTQKVMKLAGGFAYSATKRDEIENLAALLKINGLKAEDNRITIQHVVGTNYNISEILEITAHYHIPLTLLGYKQDGRGNKFKTGLDAFEAYQEVRKFTKANYLRLGIDTALAQEWKKFLEADNISPTLYHTQEGKFSMYIDAVEGKAGAASYGNVPMQTYGYSGSDENYKPVKRKGKELMEIFKEL